VIAFAPFVESGQDVIDQIASARYAERAVVAIAEIADARFVMWRAMAVIKAYAVSA